MFRSVVHSNREALEAISGLYLHGDLHLDVCYNSGSFYKGSALVPEIKQDLTPYDSTVVKMDVTNMRHSSQSIRSVMFDPPWFIKRKKDSGNKLAERYGSFVSPADMFLFQDKALEEIHRVLIPGGWLITKLQDCTYGRQKYFLSVYQANKARELGLDLIDSIVLTSRSQYRAKTAGRLTAISAHCFFQVYRKAVRAKRIVRY
jgi:hypothetical protein